MSEVARSAPAISAHRGGGDTARSDTYEAYRSALKAGAEYVEFDVRRTSDGTLVAFHPARLGWGRAVAALSYAKLCDLAGYEVPRMAELMQLLAGRAVGHVDLKETSGADVIVRHAVEVLGPDGFIVTTGEDAVVTVLKRRFPAVPVGLSIGGDTAEATAFAVRRLCSPGLSRLDRVVASRADVAVVHHRLARTGVLAECRRRGIKTMVWTVNGDQALAGWLTSPHVDVLVTDRPARAIALRRRLDGPGRDTVRAGHICPQAEASGNDGGRNPALTWELEVNE
jgi:glycerophosphoryl diester phosphodiesterase